jgi:hypothetical protein
MAKRITGVGRKKKSHTHKTKKRLAAKREMLKVKASKNYRHTRPIHASAR